MILIYCHCICKFTMVHSKIVTICWRWAYGEQYCRKTIPHIFEKKKHLKYCSRYCYNVWTTLQCFAYVILDFIDECTVLCCSSCSVVLLQLEVLFSCYRISIKHVFSLLQQVLLLFLLFIKSCKYSLKTLECIY